jgi:HSP20 family protein
MLIVSFLIEMAHSLLLAPPPGLKPASKFQDFQVHVENQLEDLAMWENWNVFREIDALHREIDRMFGAKWPFQRRLSRSAFLPGLSARNYPMVNVYEDPEALHIEALAPGLDTDSLEVTVKNNMLTIAGEKKPIENLKPDAYHRNERATGRFVRTLQLGTYVDEEGVSARYEDGILSVRLPKSEKAKPKQIPVKVGK